MENAREGENLGMHGDGEVEEGERCLYRRFRGSLKG